MSLRCVRARVLRPSPKPLRRREPHKKKFTPRSNARSTSTPGSPKLEPRPRGPTAIPVCPKDRGAKEDIAPFDAAAADDVALKLLRHQDRACHPAVVVADEAEETGGVEDDLARGPVQIGERVRHVA